MSSALISLGTYYDIFSFGKIGEERSRIDRRTDIARKSFKDMGNKIEDFSSQERKTERGGDSTRQLRISAVIK